MSKSETAPKFTNRLALESSPYLLKHAHNPVEWYAWGEEALARARNEDKPILLSIGYSSCHWCSVMHEESFENEAIAGLMNQHFVCIKVDREERPDLDAIYMNAVQMMTGRGGWPMTVFLTPEGVPFYGGTYYPPVDRRGMPGFPRILISIAEAYREQREQISANAETLAAQLAKLSEFTPVESLSYDILDSSAQNIMRAFDPENGGFGNAPKFPPAMVLTFLLRQSQRTNDTAIAAAIEKTLVKMARGGMYDQLGGGFHRYSVDEKWLVPHFEKMLYDNALLSRIYLDAWLVTGRSLYREIADEILDYVTREMTSEDGGFFSSQDADSEGEEGLFFVWRPEQVTELLGEKDAALFNSYYDITVHGNFEHAMSIPHVNEEIGELARILGVSAEKLSGVVSRGRKVLFDAREKRIKPARDEKILTAWNGLMLRSFAEAARITGRADYLATAIANAEFVTGRLMDGGRLLRTYKDGTSKLNAYQEDYACLIDGLLSLYESTFDERWFVIARELADVMIDLFWDPELGGFFFTSRDHEQLISRSKESYDNATPSGNSVAADVLLRLGMLSTDARYHELARKTIELLAGQISRYPNAFGHLLCALDLYLSPGHEVAIIGNRLNAAPLLEAINKRYLPNKVVALRDPASETRIGLLKDRDQVDGNATAYVCHNYICTSPVTSPADLLALV